ncbi:hypothetical protein [Iningainema tapete]|uniref:Uncharacterized protein n=1 Tax=Iningainema tapete BLCC-T55 TaxID=2748662 RepID=A0A8J6XK40_9CYAN|nr:hypothetical protein [Iningainema tapete]MBD2774310.1 hypothetical protein [Iningainema tapete BLCC-T55]
MDKPARAERQRRIGIAKGHGLLPTHPTGDERTRTTQDGGAMRLSWDYPGRGDDSEIRGLPTPWGKRGSLGATTHEGNSGIPLME